MATPAHTTHIWRFGVFEVDAQKEELRRSGVPIKLREQSFRVLVSLLERSGELITRDNLRQALWPSDTFVDFDHGLNTAVMKLREALGDTADKPLYIETIPKRGYRFIAPIHEEKGSGRADTGKGNLQPQVVEVANLVQLPAAVQQSTIGKRWRTSVVIICLSLLSFSAIFLYLRGSHTAALQAGKSRVSSTLAVTPIMTQPGNAMFPVFSPDGKWIAFVWNGPNRSHYDLYVQLVGDGNPLPLTHNKSGFIGNPAWSPDGAQIAFSRCDGKNNGVYLISAFGGNERKLTSVFCGLSNAGAVVWLADGSGLLMDDVCADERYIDIVLFSFASGAKRCLTGLEGRRRPDKGIGFRLSPDGKTIAFRPGTFEKACCDLYTVPVSGGIPKQLTFDRQLNCDVTFPGNCIQYMWTADSNSIVFVSDKTNVPWLWRVSANGGPIEPITTYPAIGDISKDGEHLVYAQTTRDEPSAIWRANLAGPGGLVLHAGKTIGYSQFGESDAQQSPTGTDVVWMSSRSGFAEIWILRSANDSPTQLTHLQGYSGTPRWSPDGKWIAFDFSDLRTPVGDLTIMKVDSDGRNLRPITTEHGRNCVPSWSRDGKSIYFASNRSGRFEVWKHNLETSEETQITRKGGFNPFESYDGDTVYFSKFLEAGIWSVPSSGGTESLVIADKPQVGYWGYWAATKSGLYVLNMDADPRPAIEFYSFSTHRSSTVLTFEMQPAPGMPSLSASMDGKTIYYTQRDIQSALKMIELPR